jgi:hypothetical protein
MKVQIKLIEATPNTLWTQGEVKNVTAAGMPTVTQSRSALGDGTRFITSAGLHAYGFVIVGDGAVKVQAFDADTGVALAAASPFDTKEVHGGHTYVFGVV